MLHRAVIFLMLVFLLGCSDDDKPRSDIGTMDISQMDLGLDGLIVDQGTSVDQGADQTIKPDASSSACNPGLDLKPLLLATDYCVVYRVEFQSTVELNGFNFKENTYWLYFGAGQPFQGSISEYTIDPQTGKPGSGSSFFSFSPASTAKLFAGEYLALSPGGFVAVGYTTEQTLVGEVFWGDKGIKTPKQVDQATGNYDVIFLDDKTMLINGTGVGSVQDGQGIYLYQEGQKPRLLIKEMGTFSGHLALGKSVLFAGGYFSSGNKIYGFSLTEVMDAIQTNKTLAADTDGDLIFSENLSDATALGNDLVVTKLDASWAFKSVSLIPIAVAGNKVSSAAANLDLVTAGGNANVGRLASSDEVLGLYLKDNNKTELAFIKKK